MQNIIKDDLWPIIGGLRCICYLSSFENRETYKETANEEECVAFCCDYGVLIHYDFNYNGKKGCPIVKTLVNLFKGKY